MTNTCRRTKIIGRKRRNNMFTVISTFLQPFMHYIVIGLIIINLATGAVVYGLYKYNASINEEKAQLAVQLQNVVHVNEDNLKTIDGLLADSAKQQKQMSALRTKSANAEDYKDRLIKKFAEHDLEALALQNPTLIESRINDATKKVFDQFESDTATTAN